MTVSSDQFDNNHCCFFLFFFFQAEDGIRDDLVTGVQTCALPILTEKTDNVRDRAIAVRLYGAVYYYLGSYDSAIKYGHKAYALSQSINDPSLLDRKSVV